MMERLPLRFWILAAAVVPASSQLHFASLGSWGRNNNDQKAVAQTLKANALRPPLSFIVSPGSNFMEGVCGTDDPSWKTHFSDVYEGPELNLPIFAALGGRDWDGNVTAMVLQTNITYGRTLAYKSPEEIEDENTRIKLLEHGHANVAEEQFKGPRWTLPNFYYHYTQSFPDSTAANSFVASPEVSAFFIFIDTKILGPAFPVDHMSSKHWNDLRQMAVAASKSYDWVIAVGDQAIFSSGASGGSEFLKRNLRPMFKENLIDAYISGVDENMEVIEDGSLAHITCGSGSGAKAGRFTSHDGSLFFASKPGYCLHTLTSKSMRTTFIDGYSGKSLYDYSKLRNPRQKLFSDRLFHLHRLPKNQYLPLPAGVGGAPGGVTILAGRHPNSIFVLLCGGFGIVSAFFIGMTALATMGKRVKRYTA